MPLKDKRIVVLGGTSGIGLAVAQAAAIEGAQVLVASSDDGRVKRALATLPASAEGHVLDLSNGTAIEASLTATMQFIVRKGEGRAMRWPRAEDAANYYVMGIDLDLDSAMREAVQEAVDFLRERFGLSAADAYALASIGVDFRVAEAVDSTQVIYGAIPKKLFKTKPAYWTAQ